MMDERGRDKYQICNGARRAENEMQDNYMFLLLVGESHFRSVSKTISIPKDCGHRRNWRTCHSRRGIFDALRKFWQKILSFAGLLIGCHSIPRSSFT
jgi:hypothetical protein